MTNIQNSNEYNYYDFMRWYKISFITSISLLFISIISIIIYGIHWSIDFTGGILIELEFNKIIHLDEIRYMLKCNGLQNTLVQNLNNKHDIIIRTISIPNISIQALGDKILTIINKLPNQHATIKHLELIGPNIDNHWIQDGIIALIVALICILIYISFRFEWRLAIGTVLALIHDIIITIGILSIFHIEIDPTVIAALMSVIGYSLNDSIVVFDRIRENLYKMNNINTYYIFNISLNQTIKRTIITSVTTMVVTIILLIFGGEILYDFSITLLIGIIIGTISSIYIASSIAFKLGIMRKHLL